MVPTEDQPEAEEVMVRLLTTDVVARPAWQDGVPRHRLREKIANPQLSIFHMEGENCAWVHKWLGAHHE